MSYNNMYLAWIFWYKIEFFFFFFFFWNFWLRYKYRIGLSQMTQMVIQFSYYVLDETN